MLDQLVNLVFLVQLEFQGFQELKETQENQVNIVYNQDFKNCRGSVELLNLKVPFKTSFK